MQRQAGHFDNHYIAKLFENILQLVVVYGLFLANNIDNNDTCRTGS